MGVFGIKGTISIGYIKLLNRLKVKKIIGVNIKSINKTIYVRSNTSDVGLLKDFFWNNTYGGENQYEIDFSNYNLGDVNTIIDAGANIGLFSVKFSAKYPDARFFCIEPEDSNFEMLKKNTEKINAKCIKAGVWYKDCKLNVATTPLSSGNVGFIVEESDDGNGIEGTSIPSIMINNCINEIDILKMDIEGSEFNIFQHVNLVEWIKKIKVLIIEVHDFYHEGGSEEIKNIMTSMGFELIKCNEDLVFISRELRKDI
ncbi:FkbM family methyltransferase [Butyrivibrio hungatei]|nr:FkbM family methyltransferase [Butyrivibrio hungatei]